MRIHRLTFAAIGPFAGEHTIDFDDLGDSALFLIDGPTGAGKSTIIDALVFALYGDVAGDTDRARLRSDHADAATESFCEVDLSVAGGRLKVRRTPAYERAKRRGAGTTPVSATLQVWRSIGPSTWEPLSRTKDEGQAEITRAIGLNRAQFVQTVVLPQGEFATFLRAESGERQPILERIFDTALYSRLQDHLDALRRTAERGIAEAESARFAAGERYVGGLAGTAWHEAMIGIAVESDEDWDRADASVRDAIAESEGAAANAQDHARTALIAATSALEKAQELQARHAAVERADRLVTQARAAVDAALRDLGAPIDDPAARREQVTIDLQELQPIALREQELPALQGALAADHATRAALLDRRAELVSERDVRLPAEVALRASLLRARRDDASRAVVEAEQVLGSMRERRLLGIAGELAAQLEPAVACPVCGSPEHPAPAQAHPDMVRAQDIEAQADELDSLRTAAESLGRTQAAVDVVRQRVGAPSTEAPPAGTASTERLAEEVATLSARYEAIADEVADVDTQLAALEARAEATRRALAQAESACETARGDFDSVADRLAHLDAMRRQLNALVEAHQAREQAELQLAEARAAVDSVMVDAAGAPQALEPLIEARDAAQREAEQAAVRCARLRELAVARADAARAVEMARDRVQACVTEAGPTIALARALGGSAGVSLAAFAVQQAFDEVLAAANIRLRAMLDGRFQLVATEERTGLKRTDLGLGLKVRDLASNTERRATTLSGGETFCASLALALGLADTVRAHAGGIEIDSLFVDEGFGSLDADRLGEVMDELLRLRAGGRMVGVISHVSEMKQMIHERIDVRPGAADRGSALTVNWMQS